MFQNVQINVHARVSMSKNMFRIKIVQNQEERTILIILLLFLPFLSRNNKMTRSIYFIRFHVLKVKVLV